jgi:hypothetical protein
MITGDVQEWIKEKWHGVFARYAEYKKQQEEKGEESGDFAVHKPDLEPIRTLGKKGKGEKKRGAYPLLTSSDPYSHLGAAANEGVGTESETEYETGMEDDNEPTSHDASGQRWKSQDHYPPLCTCSIGCWRLRGGKVEYMKVSEPVSHSLCY